MSRTVTSRSHRVVAMALAVVVVVAGSGVATALTVHSFTGDPIRMSQTDTPGLEDIIVEQRTLDYSGGSIVGVSTAINNTKLTDVSVDVVVRLETLNGTVVERQSTTVLLGLLSVTLVELTFDQARSPTEFATTNVTVSPSL